MVEKLLERTKEKEALRSAAWALGAGTSGCLVFVGGAGTGKSSLLREAGTASAEEGLLVLSARGRQLEQEYSYGVVRQLFEGLLARAEPKSRAAWLHGPAARAWSALDGQGGAGELELLHGLFWLVSNLGGTRPVALLIDDLHWADEPSLRFMAFLQNRLEDAAVLLVAATRPTVPAAPRQILDTLLTDPVGTVLRLEPLGAEATGTLLAEVLGEPPDAAFAASCHQATGGNPLLLVELGRVLRAEGLRPAGQEAARLLAGLGPRVLARRVSLELGRLPPAAPRIARAVAVLGGRADPWHVAAVAGVEPDESAAVTAELVAAELLRSSEGLLEFVHPLVRATVHEGMDVWELSRHHERAVDVLSGEGLRAEEIAAHLLRFRPRTAEQVALLRAAADEAVARRAPRAAHAYLSHALSFPLPPGSRLELLAEAIRLGAQVDLTAALAHLHEALELTGDPLVRGELVAALGFAPIWLERTPAFVSLLKDAIDSLPTEADNLRRRLEATLLGVPTLAGTPTESWPASDDRSEARIVRTGPHEPGGRPSDWLSSDDRSEASIGPTGPRESGGHPPDWLSSDDRSEARIVRSGPQGSGGWPSDWPGRLRELRELPASPTLDAHLLEAMISLCECYAADPRAVGRARAALTHPRFAGAVAGPSPAYGAYWALLAGDLEAGVAAFESALASARSQGSLAGLVIPLHHLGAAMLWRGELADAERHLREVLALTRAMPVGSGLTLASSGVLGEVLLEQGRREEAEAVLRSAETGDGPAREPGMSVMFHQLCRALLLRSRGEHEAALEYALAAGRSFADHGGVNPALLPWRSLSALCLHSLGRDAREPALEEVALAERWGAAPALGRALRRASLVLPEPEAADSLRRALDVLEGTPARLELARALIAQGARLRRNGDRAEARRRLARGLELAHRSGAQPLLQQARAELRAAGGRTRRRAPSGPAALTPSELRVAALAAQGHTNREIAQRLYITTKTVELHLSNTFRKLNINRRTQLIHHLTPTKNN